MSSYNVETQTAGGRKPALVAITMGDPAGVGPEICLDALVDDRVLGVCRPVVFGDAGVMEAAARATGRGGGGQWQVVEADDASLAGQLDRVTSAAIVDCRCIHAAECVPGRVDAATGRASLTFIERAVAAAIAKTVSAVVTAPIHKEAVHAAGSPHPGHTEMIAALTGAGRHCMMLASDELACSLVTTHMGLCEVADALDSSRILDVIQLTADAVDRMGRNVGGAKDIAVLGLNPHAGEGGLFGRREEERIIAPAIEAARARGIPVAGPLPPDTAFLPGRRATTSAHVCMYHDQGLIPLKMLSFDTAVNVTLGLPIIRTSVDHGTALDIAWQGRASGSSLVEAVLMAVRLSAVVPPAPGEPNFPTGPATRRPL